MTNNFEEEIDFIQILKKIYVSRRVILYTTFIFFMIGIAISLLSPIKFTSSTVFLPQNQDNTTSSLSGVASLVGINLGTSTYGGDITPLMYPKIGESIKFKRLLLEKIVDEKNNKTLKKILIENYKIQDNDQLNLNKLGMSKLEEKCFNILSEIIYIDVNQKEGFVTIGSTMSTGKYSAIVAKYSREILQSIIIENKIETARQNLIFSEKQLKEKKMEFDEIQSKLAFFSDSNLNPVNSFVINEKNKLEADFQIISAVVTELSKQVEQAKLQVTKDTPVFSTIKEVVIPNQRSSPKRKQLVLIFSCIGFIISCIYILIKDPLNTLIKEIN